MEYNINNWYQEQILQEQEDSGGLRYHITSFVLHVLATVAAVAIGTMMPTPIVPVLTEFTFIDSAAGAASASTSPQQTATSKIQSAEISSPVQNTKISADTVIVPKIKSQAKLKAAKMKMQPAAKKMAIKKSAVTKAAKSVAKMHHGPTVKQSELVAPILETDEFEKSLHENLHAQKTKKFDDRTLTEDLNKIDAEQEQKVAALQNEMDNETNSFMAEQNEDLRALEAEKNSTQKMLKTNADKMRAAESAKIAAAQAAEKAEADRAGAIAAANARAEQAAKQALAAQEARALSEKSSAGRGAGADGSAFGVNGPVRSLDDIRQMPGNKRPQYDNDDRFNNRQGEISFLAYVSSNGQITQMKLIKATGHRSLDAKTLQAIRNWKFYPGQEGWVEIPFRWDLKGGPQEMPTTLRRSISQK